MLGQKTAKFGPKLAFWPNIGICGQFGPMANQKNDANKVPRWFFCYVDIKSFASFQKNKDFWPKNGHIWPKIGIFGEFGPNIGILGPSRLMPYQNIMQTRCLGDFSVMWVPKLLLSPVKIRIFALKRHNFAQKLHSWSFSAGLCRLIWCPVGGLVGGCGPPALSRKTPIYFI